jgi:hypothetical protein
MAFKCNLIALNVRNMSFATALHIISKRLFMQHGCINNLEIKLKRIVRLDLTSLRAYKKIPQPWLHVYFIVIRA